MHRLEEEELLFLRAEDDSGSTTSCTTTSSPRTSPSLRESTSLMSPQKDDRLRSTPVELNPSSKKHNVSSSSNGRGGGDDRTDYRVAKGRSSTGGNKGPARRKAPGDFVSPRQDELTGVLGAVSLGSDGSPSPFRREGGGDDSANMRREVHDEFEHQLLDLVTRSAGAGGSSAVSSASLAHQQSREQQRDHRSKARREGERNASSGAGRHSQQRLEESGMAARRWLDDVSDSGGGNAAGRDDDDEDDDDLAAQARQQRQSLVMLAEQHILLKTLLLSSSGRVKRKSQKQHKNPAAGMPTPPGSSDSLASSDTLASSTSESNDHDNSNDVSLGIDDPDSPRTNLSTQKKQERAKNEQQRALSSKPKSNSRHRASSMTAQQTHDDAQTRRARVEERVVRRLTRTSPWTLCFHKPAVEAEYVLFYMTSGGGNVNLSIVFAVFMLAMTLAMQLLFTDTILLSALSVIVPAWALWVGGLMWMVYLRAQRIKWSKIALHETNGVSPQHHSLASDTFHSRTSPSSVALEAPSAVTYFGTLQFFSQSTARKALCSIAQRCEYASILFFLGCLEYIAWQLWTKERCSGLQGEIKFLICTSAIQFEGSILLLVPLGAFFMPMRWIMYGPMAVFSAVFFFAVRWIPGMPERDDKYLISSALVFGGALCICMPSIFLIEKARRAEFLLIIRRHLRLMEMSILSEKKRELLLMYGAMVGGGCAGGGDNGLFFLDENNTSGVFGIPLKHHHTKAAHLARQRQRLQLSGDQRLKQKLLLQLSAPRIDRIMNPMGIGKHSGTNNAAASGPQGVRNMSLLSTTLHRTQHQRHQLISPHGADGMPLPSGMPHDATVVFENCIVACIHLPNFPLWLSLRAPADGVVLMQQYLTLMSELRLSYQAVATQLVEKIVSQWRRRPTRGDQQKAAAQNLAKTSPGNKDVNNNDEDDSDMEDNPHQADMESLFLFVECQAFGDVCYIFSHIPDFGEAPDEPTPSDNNHVVVDVSSADPNDHLRTGTRPKKATRKSRGSSRSAALENHVGPIDAASRSAATGGEGGTQGSLSAATSLVLSKIAKSDIARLMSKDRTHHTNALVTSHGGAGGSSSGTFRDVNADGHHHRIVRVVAPPKSVLGFLARQSLRRTLRDSYYAQTLPIEVGVALTDDVEGDADDRTLVTGKTEDSSDKGLIGVGDASSAELSSMSPKGLLSVVVGHPHHGAPPAPPTPSGSPIAPSSPKTPKASLHDRVKRVLKSLHLAFAADMATQFEELVMDPQRGGAWFITNPAHTADSVVEKAFPVVPGTSSGTSNYRHARHTANSRDPADPSAGVATTPHQRDGGSAMPMRRKEPGGGATAARGNMYGTPIVASTITFGSCEVQLTPLTNGGSGGGNGALLLTGPALTELCALRRQFTELVMPAPAAVLEHSRGFSPEGIYQDRPFLLADVASAQGQHHHHPKSTSQQREAAKEAMASKARTQLQQVRFVLCSERFLESSSLPAAEASSPRGVIDCSDNIMSGSSNAAVEFEAVRLRVLARRLRLISADSNSGTEESGSSAANIAQSTAAPKARKDKTRRGRRASFGLPSASSIQLGASFSASTFASGLGSGGRSRGSRSGSVAAAPTAMGLAGPGEDEPHPSLSHRPHEGRPSHRPSGALSPTLFEHHPSSSFVPHPFGTPVDAVMDHHSPAGQQHHPQHATPQFVIPGGHRLTPGSAPSSVGRAFVSPFVAATTRQHQFSTVQMQLQLQAPTSTVPGSLQHVREATVAKGFDVAQDVVPQQLQVPQSSHHLDSPRGAMTPIGAGGMVVPMLQLSSEYTDMAAAIGIGGVGLHGGGGTGAGSGYSEPTSGRQIKESPSSSSMNELIGGVMTALGAVGSEGNSRRSTGPTATKKTQMAPPPSSGGYILRSFALTIVRARVCPLTVTPSVLSRDGSPVGIDGVRASLALPSTSSSLAAMMSTSAPTGAAEGGFIARRLAAVQHRSSHKHFSASISAGSVDEAAGPQFTNDVVMNPLALQQGGKGLSASPSTAATTGESERKSSSPKPLERRPSHRLSIDSKGQGQADVLPGSLPDHEMRVTPPRSDSGNQLPAGGTSGIRQLVEVGGVAHMAPVNPSPAGAMVLTEITVGDTFLRPTKPLTTFTAFFPATTKSDPVSPAAPPLGLTFTAATQHPAAHPPRDDALLSQRDPTEPSAAASRDTHRADSGGVDPAAMRTTWFLLDEFVDPRYEAAFLSNVDDLYRAERGLFFSVACFLFAVLLVFIVFVVYDGDIPRDPRGRFPGTYLLIAAALALTAIIIQLVIIVTPALWVRTLPVPIAPRPDEDDADINDDDAAQLGNNHHSADSSSCEEGALEMRHLVDPRRRQRELKTRRNRRRRLVRPAYVAPTPFRTLLRQLNVISWLAFCALIFTAIVVSPMGNVLGNGRVVWLYCLTGLSHVRSPSLKPVWMWATGELPISIAFLLEAAAFPYSPIMGHKLSNIYGAIMNMIYCLVFRCLWCRADRYAFASQQHLLLIADEIAEKEDQVAKIMSDMAPKGVAREFMERFSEIFASVAVQLRHMAAAATAAGVEGSNQQQRNADAALPVVEEAPVFPAAVPEVYRSLLTQQAGYGAAKRRQPATSERKRRSRQSQLDGSSGGISSTTSAGDSNNSFDDDDDSERANDNDRHNRVVFVSRLPLLLSRQAALGFWYPPRHEAMEHLHPFKSTAQVTRTDDTEFLVVALRWSIASSGSPPPVQHTTPLALHFHYQQQHYIAQVSAQQWRSMEDQLTYLLDHDPLFVGRVDVIRASPEGFVLAARRNPKRKVGATAGHSQTTTTREPPQAEAAATGGGALQDAPANNNANALPVDNVLPPPATDAVPSPPTPAPAPEKKIRSEGRTHLLLALLPSIHKLLRRAAASTSAGTATVAAAGGYGLPQALLLSGSRSRHTHPRGDSASSYEQTLLQGGVLRQRQSNHPSGHQMFLDAPPGVSPVTPHVAHNHPSIVLTASGVLTAGTCSMVLLGPLGLSEHLDGLGVSSGSVAVVGQGASGRSGPTTTSVELPLATKGYQSPEVAFRRFAIIGPCVELAASVMAPQLADVLQSTVAQFATTSNTTMMSSTSAAGKSQMSVVSQNLSHTTHTTHHSINVSFYATPRFIRFAAAGAGMSVDACCPRRNGGKSCTLTVVDPLSLKEPQGSGGTDQVAGPNAKLTGGGVRAAAQVIVGPELRHRFACLGPPPTIERSSLGSATCMTTCSLLPSAEHRRQQLQNKATAAAATQVAGALPRDSVSTTGDDSGNNNSSSVPVVEVALHDPQQQYGSHQHPLSSQNSSSMPRGGGGFGADGGLAFSSSPSHPLGSVGREGGALSTTTSGADATPSPMSRDAATNKKKVAKQPVAMQFYATSLHHISF